MRNACLLGRTAMLALGLLLASCAGQPATFAGSDNSGDGQLDCDDGEVVQGAGIEVFADSEDEVVALALQRWTSTGASLVALPPDESWSAVTDGRDVAIAYPERNGDGRWTVDAVLTCGPLATGPAPTDRSLDCVNDTRWGHTGAIDSTVPGLPTPREALQSALAPFLDSHGGELVMVGQEAASLVLEDREQVIASVIEVDAGGWVVISISGCQGFER